MACSSLTTLPIDILALIIAQLTQKDLLHLLKATTDAQMPPGHI
jgi:hypothetical protein